MTPRRAGGWAYRSALLAALLAACAASPGYDRAQVLYRRGDYALAEAAYRDFLRENPRSSLVPAGHLGLAWALYQQGKYKEAASEVERLRTRFPGHPILPAARLLEAKAYLAAGDAPRAAEEARALAEDEAGRPVAVEARFVEAEALYRMARYPKAAEVYGAFLEKAPKDAAWYADARIARADALFYSGDEVAAAAAYGDFWASYPSHAEAPRALAMAARLSEARFPDTAVGYWKTYLERFPDGPSAEEALERLTFVLAARRPTEAEAYALRLFRTGSETAAERAARFLYDRYRARGDTAAAAALDEEAALRLPPRFPVARDAAARRARRALAPFASDAAFAAVLAGEERFGLLPAEDAGRALMLAEAFLSRFGDHPEAERIAKDRATALFVLGRWQEADEALEAAIARYGATAGDRMRLAEIKRMRGDLEGAEEILAGLRKTLPPSDPRYASVLYRSAVLADLRGDLPAAVRAIRELQRIAPDRLTPVEAAWWRLREEELARLAAPPAPAETKPAGTIEVAVAGFLGEDTSGLGMVLSQVLAAGLSLEPNFAVVPTTPAARAILRDPARPPDDAYPLRSRAGADFVVAGRVDPDTAVAGRARVAVVVLRIRPEGLLPIRETFLVGETERLAFPRRLLSWVAETCRKFHPVS